jgi:hypothetical protein
MVIRHSNASDAFISLFFPIILWFTIITSGLRRYSNSFNLQEK